MRNFSNNFSYKRANINEQRLQRAQNSLKIVFARFYSYIFTRLTVQAKENYFMAVRRHALYYNKTDLLGISGGILALFLSTSLFSVSELIFYIANFLIKRKTSNVSIERQILKNDDLDVDNN